MNRKWRMLIVIPVIFVVIIVLGSCSKSQEADKQKVTAKTEKPAVKKAVIAPIPWEGILTVNVCLKVEAKDPRCSNWKWEESYTFITCSEDPDAKLEDEGATFHYIKVTMGRRHSDIRKDFIDFNQMAENLVPGVQVRIEANARTTRRGLEPGMRLPKKCPSPVYTEKSGNMTMIVVPHTRLSIIEIKEITAKKAATR